MQTRAEIRADGRTAMIEAANMAMEEFSPHAKSVAAKIWPDGIEALDDDNLNTAYDLIRRTWVHEQQQPTRNRSNGD